MSKPEKRKINGVLLLDKPHGISSNHALQKVKKIFSAAKCGHTGTLDPMATGLLPICFGEATKFSAHLLGAEKSYIATLKLGFLSTTGDAEGEIHQLEIPEYPTQAKCERILLQFTGTTQQIPPMYSALKYQGKPLYQYARNGDTIARPARDINIDTLQILSLHDDELRISVRCSSGTYIRVLAEDIGKALGCGGAYLTDLRRTEIDRFNIAQAQTLQAIEDLESGERQRLLLSIDHLLQDYPVIQLNDLMAKHILQGRIVACPSDASVIPEGAMARLYNEQQQFLGLGVITPERAIVAKRLLSGIP
ncbi:tRNA pseudouridine(55) synthase TruB [Nitrosomonas sp. sh817]|uniref:tRNA pseudouridine(55) synthase TruB n=1 Tax=Nitrosomonas sp. sh817 TaxID=3070658 RepID=UPI0027DC1DEB|nr:tRNA pseudouridine(55) synthase TruB [Nitrosomonas sp. sh817]WMJ07432.1 tRNA pseudouridine(55) synthase TruB [Nitrosomonas sp. sh817]